MIANCLNDNDFKYPDFKGEGGLPLNIESLLNILASRYGIHTNWIELVPAILTARSFMDRVEDYWERGDGSKASHTGPLHHNLGVWGFQVSDAYSLSEQFCIEHTPTPIDNLLNQLPEDAMYRTARRTLNPSYDNQYSLLSQISAANQIAIKEGKIENLIFWLGSNNCLGTVARLCIKESCEKELTRYPHQRQATLWRPEHFKKVLDIAVEQILEISIDNVFIATIPHVTIPPLSRGVTPGASSGEGQDDKGYFEYYTHFWIWDTDFSPDKHPYLVREQIRYIDFVIDQYNQIIRDIANENDWYLVDMCALLDKVAFRRNKGKVGFVFPTELVEALQNNPATSDRVFQGKPMLDTRYLRINTKENDPRKKYAGGLFSLDGTHPTTLGYGIIANEFLNIMKSAGVSVPTTIDWNLIVTQDSLLTAPPPNLSSLQGYTCFPLKQN